MAEGALLNYLDSWIRNSISVMNEYSMLSKLWCVIPKKCHCMPLAGKKIVNY